jgi:hypothetical protein
MGVRMMTPATAWFLRIAGISGLINGLGFGGFTIPTIISVSQGHGILYVFGNPTYGDGPFGVSTTVPMLVGFLVACAVQAAGGVLLLWPRLLGVVVLLAGMLLGTVFWWGFDLPLAWLNAATVLAFLILAWTFEKASSRSSLISPHRRRTQ